MASVLTVRICGHHMYHVGVRLQLLHRVRSAWNNAAVMCVKQLGHLKPRRKRGRECARQSATCTSASIGGPDVTEVLPPSRQRDCHFAAAPYPPLLKHLRKGEGGAAE